jgi:hypothetical protein
MLLSSARSLRALYCGVGWIALSLFGECGHLRAQTVPAALGSAAWFQVGRTAVNPTTGQGFGYGYYTRMAGLSGPFFSGAPSESTAYFTFRTSVFQIVPLKPNGDINMAIVMPDTFKVFYNTNTKRDWNNPDSFTTGVLVATFSRDEFLLLRIWESFGTEYVHLDSSFNFTHNNATVNLGSALSAAALTSTYSNAPLPALPGYSTVIGFAGHAVILAAGSSSPQPDPQATDQP